MIDKFGELGHDEVVFNWNTKDRAVALLDEEHFAITFAGTAALPMEYIPAGKTLALGAHELTEVGSRYFTSIGDPNLLRVAQYTSFFQIARLAQLAGTWREEMPDLVGKQEVLGTYFKQAFTAVKTCRSIF